MGFGILAGAGELGLIGFVFSSRPGVVYFHNPLRQRRLHWVYHLGNWLCFA